jgi:hypothetical protein
VIVSVNGVRSYEERLRDHQYYEPGRFRWFRARNVSDLMALRRERGLTEWHERFPGAGFSIIEVFRAMPLPPWPPHVVELPVQRRVVGEA